MARTARLFRRGRKVLRRGRKRVRKTTRRRVRPLLSKVGFGPTRRFLFFRFTPQGRAIRPFAKAIGL